MTMNRLSVVKVKERKKKNQKEVGLRTLSSIHSAQLAWQLPITSQKRQRPPSSLPGRLCK
jgi:hypothetical protein